MSILVRNSRNLMNMGCRRIGGPILLMVALAMGHGSSALAANAWEGFPPPPDSKVIVVSDYIVRNNLPQSIRSFTSQRRPDEVVEYYLNVWDAQGPGKPLLSQALDEKVVSKGSSDYFMTMQVKDGPNGGSRGFMSVIFFNDIKKDAPPPGAGIPVPDHTQVLSDLVSVDGPKKSRMVILRNNHSVDYNARFYQSSYRFEGWTQTQELSLKDGSSTAYTFRQGLVEASVTISDKADDTGQTGILVSILSPN